MARISTYALDAAINDADKLIGTDADNNNVTKNFSLEGIAEYVIDKLIDPDSNQALIPVFRNVENVDGDNATRITGSIMYQDTYPTGTQIGIAGNLLVEKNATVYLNLSVAGESYLLGNVYLGTTSADAIKQRGTLELLAPVKDSTGTLGSNEQVLVSNASGVLSWENYQGTGLEFQSSWNAATNVPDLTAIPLDSDNTGKYWVVSVEGTTDLSGISQWSPGDWAIISQDDSDNVFWSKIDNSSVDGLGEINKLAVWDSPKTLTFTQDIEFTAPSTLTLGNGGSSEAKIILDQYNPSIELGDTFKISHPLNGNAIISETGSGDLLLISDNELEIKSGQLGETFARFTNNGPIELYYDNTKVFNTSSTGIAVTGAQSIFTGGILATGNINSQGTVEGEALTINTGPSVITGELDKDGSKITNLADPTVAQDAATKFYVDSQLTGNVTGNGQVYYGAMWDGAVFGASGSDQITTSPLSFRITDTGAGVEQPRSLAFGGSTTATGQRNSVALGYNNRSSAEATFSTGHETWASGKHAASFNFETLASGEKSAAFGDNTTASGKSSFAIGNQTIAATSLSFAGGKNAIANPNTGFETAFAYGASVIATGNNSAAFGLNTQATGERAFVTGTDSVASGNNAVALGGQNQAIADQSFSAGFNNESRGPNSVTLGSDNYTTYFKSTVIGNNLTADQTEQVVLGRNNAYSGANFVVGCGPFVTDKRNGLEISAQNVKIPQYGDGTPVVGNGSVVSNLAVDSNGVIVETSPAGAPDYLSAVLLLSQSGNSAPTTVNVLENTLGISTPLSWTRVSSGEYNLNAPGKFKLLKTIVFVNGGSAENNHDVAWEVIDVDNLRIRTHNSDDKLTKASLEIRTYN